MADVKISDLPNGDALITGAQGRVDVPVTVSGVTYQVDAAKITTVPPDGAVGNQIPFIGPANLVIANGDLQFTSDTAGGGGGSDLLVNAAHAQATLAAVGSGPANALAGATAAAGAVLVAQGGSAGAGVALTDTPVASVVSLANLVGSPHVFVGTSPSGRPMPTYFSTLRSRMSHMQLADYSDKTIYRWFPAGVAAGQWTGMNTPTQNGTAAYTLPTTTNRYTAQARETYKSVVTTLNQDVGLQGTNFQFWRGDGTNGGFFFHCRFGIENWTAGNRFFVGFSATSNVTGVNPSTLTNIIGFGIDAGDTAFTFMHNDGAGTATKDTIAGQPTLAANQAYDAWIFCDKVDTTQVHYRLDDFIAGTNIIDTTTNTDLPVNTTMLLPNMKTSNASTTTVAAAGIGILRAYIEVD